jgi:hypothetical protein
VVSQEGGKSGQMTCESDCGVAETTEY